MKLKKIFALATTAIFFMSANFVEAKSPVPKKIDKKISAEQKNSEPEVRVGILINASQVTLEMSAPCVITDATTKKQIRKIDANKKFILDASKLKSDAVEIRGDKNLQVTINNKKYFGGVRINKNSNSITVINLVPMEEYLRGVLPEEMSPSFSKEALKAQAVAARTYMLKNSDKHKAEGFNVCATTHCQMYEGVENISDQTDLAIKETRGEVLYFGGEVALTVFHTDSGGMTASGLEVWGTDTPYLQSVAELQKQTQAWTKKFTKAAVASRFGSDFGELQKIESVSKTKSGRIKAANFVGSKKTVSVIGSQIRSKFKLSSTLCNIKIAGDEVIFSGFGLGHGVGMSQHGANNFAKAGWTYDKILLHYYKGTELKKIY